MQYWEAELHNEWPDRDLDQPSTLDDEIDSVEIDGDDDDVETYLARTSDASTSEVDEYYNEFINEDGITAAGYDLLADLDANGDFV